MPATWVDRSASWNDAAKYLKISGILFYFIVCSNGSGIRQRSDALLLLTALVLLAPLVYGGPYFQSKGVNGCRKCNYCSSQHNTLCLVGLPAVAPIFSLKG
jgi:hypothetical protein